MPNLDNPGGGNCGFYAFGIGLIDAIQKEHSDAGTCPTLDNLNSFLEQPLRIEDILSFDLRAYKDNYTGYKREFLNNLQVILRNIASLGYVSNLRKSVLREKQGHHSQIEGTMIFNKFMEVVYSKVNKTPLSSQFNELVLSPKVKELAELVALLSQNLPKTLTIDQRDRIVTDLAKDIFMQDILDERAHVKYDSAILSATNVITQSGHWATHQDLQSIAAELEINLNVNGQLNGANMNGAPTVTLKNSANVHWTTEVVSIPGLEESLPRPVTPEDISSLSPIAKTVFYAMISAVESSPNREQFKAFVYSLINTELEPEHAVIGELDKAEAVEGQTDEQFAQSLQDAEFRKVGLKR